MTNVLYLTCSPRGGASFSRRMGDELVAGIGGAVLTRDLADDPPPLVDAGFSAAILAPPADDIPPALAVSEALIREVEAADVLVIATPMNNFGVPAVLKAWVDQIVRINRTFRSTPQGKVGLLRDRPAWLVVAAGGWFTRPSPTGTPPQPDFLTGYIRVVLETIGIRSLHVIVLEGVTRGPDIAAQAMENARAEMKHLLGAQMKV